MNPLYINNEGYEEVEPTQDLIKFQIKEPTLIWTNIGFINPESGFYHINIPPKSKLIRFLKDPIDDVDYVVMFVNPCLDNTCCQVKMEENDRFAIRGIE